MEQKYRICHICSYFETPIFSDMIQHQMDFTELRIFYYQHMHHSFQDHGTKYVDECPCYNYWDRFFFFKKQVKAIRAYKKLYTDKQFQLNFAHSMFTNGYVAYKLKQDWKIPYIVAIQNTDLNVFFKYMLNLRKTGIEILLEAEKIIVASNSYKLTLLERYIPLKYQSTIEKKIQVIPYGINDFYAKNQYDRKQTLTNNVAIISVGRINRNKNQLMICKAIKKLILADDLAIELEVIGPCANKKLLDKIKKYSFVKYYDYLNKEILLEHYQKADLFILVSKTETFGLVYAEALSQGLPIIYTKNQGFDMQFPEGKVGYHTAVNVKKLYKQIKRLMLDYPEIQENCVQASIKFHWDIISECYKDLYSQILD